MNKSFRVRILYSTGMNYCPTHHWQPLTEHPSTESVPRTGTFLINGSLKTVTLPHCSREGLCLLFPETAFMKDNSDLHGTKFTFLLTLFIFPFLSPFFPPSCPPFLAPFLSFFQPWLLNLGSVMC